MRLYREKIIAIGQICLWSQIGEILICLGIGILLLGDGIGDYDWSSASSERWQQHWQYRPSKRQHNWHWHRHWCHLPAQSEWAQIRNFMGKLSNHIKYLNLTP